jgi:two-component system, OmpR family, heavy metal sensor histidine kinase CusS
MTRRHRVSLSLRMMICVTLAIILCLLLMRAIVERSIDFHFMEQDANDLQAVATTIEQVILRYKDEADQLQAALNQAVPLPHGTRYAVSDPQGHVLYAGPDAASSLLAIDKVATDRIEPRQLTSWEEGGRSYRGASLRSRTGSNELVISVAMDLSFHDHFMSELRRTLWAVTLGAGLLTLAVVWVALSQGLAPVRRLSASIRGIRSDRLQTRLDPATVPRELTELVNSFNQMLGQLDESYSRLSHFSADIAHELRTPLTNVITQTQVALGSGRSAGEYCELLHSNLEELERLARMVSDMLWLAQADRGLITPAFEILDLTDEARSLLEYFGVLAEEKHVQIALEGAAQGVLGDRAMVRRALANLLSNAIRHTPESGGVTIRLGQDRDRVRVSVENTGPGIPAEHLSRVFDRFYQVDPSRSRRGEGSGLGLAIVRSIVTLHGGHVHARSGKNQTTFTIDFPALSAPRSGAGPDVTSAPA